MAHRRPPLVRAAPAAGDVSRRSSQSFRLQAFGTFSVKRR